MKKRVAFPLLTLVAALAGYGVVSWGQPSLPVVSYSWDYPTQGSQVHHFVGEQRLITMAGDTITAMLDSIPHATVQLEYEWGVKANLRVAGVDSLNRQGPWSEWSEQWIDHGPPSSPGMPYQTLVIK